MATPRRIIATEEGFNIPEVVQAVARYLSTHDDEPAHIDKLRAGYSPSKTPNLLQRLNDIGAARLVDMDAARIDASLLLSVVGVQLLERDEANAMARLTNDRAAAACRAHPGRLYAMTTIAPQDPRAAAEEFERGVKELGLKGAIVNSHTKGGYLDEHRFRPILEVAQALDAPIYIHPREPSGAMLQPFVDYHLQGSLWGFASEAALHAMRLIMSGVFDELPHLKIVLGHLGEGIPYFLDRIDIRYAQETSPRRIALKRRPSEYFHRHFVVTSSGMNWPPAVKFCQDVLGADKVMFAADHPFEDAAEAVNQAAQLEMTAQTADLFWSGNAERVFGL
jgi:5-carboxyvanillate decarboxylase